ncbi:FecR family protein [Alistipes sp.]|uniref:FecR family protein n=1 Tax=Alistipes sp. TaxID=1872444 RepID=UPI0025C5BD5F|nr:FecR family protein [Alistipes sp.]
MDVKKNMSREQLLAYMRDNCTEVEAQQVRMWLRERLKDPGLDQLFSDLLDALETEYDPESKERVRRKLDSILAACPAPKTPLRGDRFRRWRWPLRIIECAAVIAAVTLALHYRRQANTPREWVEVYAGMGERREIVLPDSTRVWLNADTKLIYPKRFNRSMRQVYLSGEMFAEVRRDEDRPFIVSADRLEVEVLGTQFNLKSYQEDAKAEVSLVCGKVSVGIKASKMNGKLTLEPGDILRLNKSNNHIDFLNFDPDSYASWIDNGNFFFVEQTLGDIVADLCRHFAVEIVITDKSLCDETYYASFVNGESLGEILDALNQDRLFSVRKEAEIYYISPCYP